ncbi:SDR family oxidoreductase [Geomonas terrae]|uniref:SDR family oxidoreductase n=1 Tax=Geomonas terrae TaxID=2562681 RepID=A0A4S1CB97_9BACT|nr:oxidoreductase [Geomonas terrae]TGU70597.1 SDR family oxidoreductase [Geomonas terrae]
MAQTNQVESLLKGQVVVITGGCGLLGSEFVTAVLRHGGRVAIGDIDTSKGEALCSSLAASYGADRVLFQKVDIRCAQSLQDAVKGISDRFGRIDALVNNAYPRNKHYGRKLEEITYQDFCENTSINLGGLFLTSQQFAMYFKEQGGGNIINLASIYGVVAPRFEVYHDTSMTMPVEYAAIKSAVIHLTKYFAKYFKGCGVRVNCISPGGIIDAQPEAFLQRYKEYALNKGMLDVCDLSGALLFLLSDLSTFVNGQNIIVDDGWTL